MAQLVKRAEEKHGRCIYFRLEDGCKKMGQCLCPVPPQFRQEYNTIWRNDPIDSHQRGYHCPCFKPKKRR